MKVNGSIFVDSNGACLLVQGNGDIKGVARDFVEMRQEAERCCDKLYYVYDDCWGVFYNRLYGADDDSISSQFQVVYQLLNQDSNITSLIKLQHESDFYKKPVPRTKGGFKREDIIDEGFVCDKASIDYWHTKWFFAHPEKIDWSGSNGVFPCIETINMVLYTELEKHPQKVRIISNNVTNDFYELIVKAKSPNERKSYSEEVGSVICSANYYKRERELEKLEERDGNKKAKVIFSIIKNGKYQFLSIDTKHCMFELCDDNGDHIGEFRFDGSPNGKSTKEPNHSLMCVNKWKQIYGK